MTPHAGERGRAAPYVVLGVALLAVSNGAIFARLAAAPPLAIAAWRVGLALLVVLPLALTAQRPARASRARLCLRGRGGRAARRPFRDLDRLARAHDDRAQRAPRQHVADLGRRAAIPRGARRAVARDARRARAGGRRGRHREQRRSRRRGRAPAATCSRSRAASRWPDISCSRANRRRSSRSGPISASPTASRASCCGPRCC